MYFCAILLSLSLVTLSQAQWWPSGSGSNANSLGGGGARFGSIQINNRANTFSSPWGASGTGMGNAQGFGQDVNLWNAATSNSWSGRRKRQTWGNGFPGFGFPSSRSNANSLGGANADWGNAWTRNNARSHSDLWGASGDAMGNAGASGFRPNAWNAATSNSEYQGRR